MSECYVSVFVSRRWSSSETGVAFVRRRGSLTDGVPCSEGNDVSVPCGTIPIEAALMAPSDAKVQKRLFFFFLR